MEAQADFQEELKVIFSDYLTTPPKIGGVVNLLMSADCKPSSVVNGHLSMQPVTRLLERWSEAKRAVSYASIYLAPGGVYMTGQSPGRRCALTTPFHPYRLLGGISLLHLPWSRLHQPLTGTLPYGARTFLMPFQARDH